MRGSAMIQLTLTETAANKVKELIQRSDPETGQPLGSIEDTYLRMYVAGGGCSGFRDGLALDRKIHEEPGTVRCENRFRMKLDSFDRMSAVSYGHDLSIAGGRADF